MTENKAQGASNRVLNPIERLSEILFGLIMVLTFTGSLSVATAERADVHEMLIGAIGCNIAWGLIDAIMYLMACMSERGGQRVVISGIQQASSAAEAHEIIRRHIPRLVSDELRHEDIERIRTGLLRPHILSGHGVLDRKDFKGAIGVYLIVTTSTLPVIVPFIFLQDTEIAMRLSNGIAVVMLGVIGWSYGKVAGISRGWMAVVMVLLGVLLVSLTIALGG